ncbi:hypothetical protein ABT330_09575 [Streptomyces sp. NPDC000658]|uniref:hypothetical protein n=1 Tax=Streptomyces sp. NPDC000658 TaxID=3154266 RepID=UPI003320F7B3
MSARLRGLARATEETVPAGRHRASYGHEAVLAAAVEAGVASRSVGTRVGADSRADQVGVVQS